MATAGKPLDLMTQRMLKRMFAAGKSRRFMAREAEVSCSTVHKWIGIFRSNAEARRRELDLLEEKTSPPRL